LCIDKPLVIIGDGEVADIVVESKNVPLNRMVIGQCWCMNGTFA